MSGALTDTSILAGASAAGAYTIDQSCRIDATNKLQKTISGDGNKTTWTMSIWTKNAFNWDITADNTLFSAQHTSGGGSGRFNAYFRGQLPNTYFECSEYTSSGYSTQLHTQAVFRDPGAWLHVIVVWDTTNNTEADRIRYYFNGERITAFGTGGTSPNYPSLNEPSSINNANCAQTIGALDGDTATSITSYLAEVHFIDGQALGPENFGETNADTNQWQAIKYAGTYGTKGYYMKFDDSGDFGNDSSGNGNDYTSTGLAATDQMVDSPTNNFCTLNPLLKPQNAVAYSEGNLQSLSTGAWNGVVGTVGVSSGKWYWEQVVVTQYYSEHGIVGDNATKWFDGGANPQTGTGHILYGYNGKKNIDNTETLYGDTFTSDDIIGVALNMDDSEVTFYKNNTAQDSGTPISFSGTIVNAKLVMPCSNQTGGGANPINEYHFNAGQDSSFAGTLTAQGNSDENGVGDFYYTPPAGYLAVCTSNFADPSIALPGENFNTMIWSGDDATRSMTGLGFQPDWVWIKQRDGTEQACWYDVLRGVTKFLAPSATTVEGTLAEGLTSFDSDGWTMGDDTANNGSGKTYVGWTWKGGGTGVSNTDGTNITSTVSANSTAGFSICTYSGTGTAGDSFGHGLSQAPELVIVKRRTFAGVTITGSDEYTSWNYYVPLSGSATAGEEDYDFFNDTAPTASIVNLSDAGAINYDNDISGNGTYVAYCFHSVEGYSKIGTYTGSSDNDGPFVYCGFKPAFLILRAWNSGQQWGVYDDARSTYNVMDDILWPNMTNAESTDAIYAVDFVSNGFKWRGNNATMNYTAINYMYYAVAESPFKTSNAR